MMVRLIAITPHPETVAGLAALTCRHPRYVREQLEAHPDMRAIPRNFGKILGKCIESGHMSVFEHVSLTFHVDGISRACSHQLVRHRLASYTQSSQRFEDAPWDRPNVIPRSIESIDARLNIYENALDAMHNAFVALIENGVPQEDARYLLPNAAQTSIIVTMNARELWHFLTLRLCKKAQWEIRALARAMRDWACSQYGFPLLFKRCGPPCAFGECREKEPCHQGEES